MKKKKNSRYMHSNLIFLLKWLQFEFSHYETAFESKCKIEAWAINILFKCIIVRKVKLLSEVTENQTLLKISLN